MIRIIKLAYKLLPKKTINALGRSTMLKGLRDKLLRPDNKEVIICEKIEKYKNNFYFFAPIQIALKAKNKGIENSLIRSSIKLLQEIKQPVVFDIGANYGFVSLAISSALGNQVKIVSFEPHPEIFKALNQSIEKNKFNNIDSYQMAVGKEVNDIELNLYGKSSNILNLNSSAIQNKIQVKQTTLDHFITENNCVPHIIKIDVDGYEMNVLRGLLETIKKHKPMLVVEYNDDYQIVEFLREHGYTLLDMNLKEFDEIPVNIFCVK